MPIPTQAKIQKALAPYNSIIRNVISEAWGEWRTVESFRTDSGFGQLLYTRTASNYIFDAIARRAIPALGSQDKVMVHIESQTFKFYTGGVLVRIKKGGEDDLGCSIPTQTALAFMDADGDLPGFPSNTLKIEIVWLPNEIWTRLDRIMVVARDGDRLIWEYELPGEESGMVVPMAPKPSQPPAGAGGELVKPKAPSKAKKNSKP